MVMLHGKEPSAVHPVKQIVVFSFRVPTGHRVRHLAKKCSQKVNTGPVRKPLVLRGFRKRLLSRLSVVRILTGDPNVRFRNRAILG